MLLTSFLRSCVGTQSFILSREWVTTQERGNQSKDQQIGIVGYEIPFNRHFYVYQPPRDLVEVDADLDKVGAEIMKLQQEVHS